MNTEMTGIRPKLLQLQTLQDDMPGQKGNTGSHIKNGIFDFSCNRFFQRYIARECAGTAQSV